VVLALIVLTADVFKMDWRGLIPIIIGLILVIKPDIRWLPLITMSKKKKSIGISHRYVLPGRQWYIILIRVLAIIGVILGFLVLFEVIHVA